MNDPETLGSCDDSGDEEADNCRQSYSVAENHDDDRKRKENHEIAEKIRCVHRERYVATTLGFNTETTDMIDEALPFRQAAKAYDRAFPQFSSTLVVVVDGDTPGLAEDGAAALARGLEDRPGVFETVYRPGGDPFFTRNGFLYLDLDALGELADNLAGVCPG